MTVARVVDAMHLRPVAAIAGAWLVALTVMLACGDVTDSTQPSPAPSTGASAIPNVPPAVNPEVILQEFPSGGSPRNQVHLVNTENGRFKARASIVLRRIADADPRAVDAVNIALADGRCTDCQTIAVALQVVLYPRGAHNVQPQNIAVAINDGCKRCITVARAIQFVVPVDDPNAVPDSVRGLVRDMDRELQYFTTVQSLSQLDPKTAMDRLNAVMAQYAELQQYLTQLQDFKQTGDDGNAASPSPSSSPSPSASASPTDATPPSAAPSPSPSPTP
jgi:hypothetical protein